MSKIPKNKEKDPSHEHGDKDEDIPLPPTDDIQVPQPIEDPPALPGQIDDPDPLPVGEPPPPKDSTVLV